MARERRGTTAQYTSSFSCVHCRGPGDVRHWLDDFGSVDVLTDHLRSHYGPHGEPQVTSALAIRSTMLALYGGMVDDNGSPLPAGRARDMVFQQVMRAERARCRPVWVARDSVAVRVANVAADAGSRLGQQHPLVAYLEAAAERFQRRRGDGTVSVRGLLDAIGGGG